MKDIGAGKVEEIIGTSSDAGELYVIRLTSESDGTKAEAFSVISWNKFKETYLKKVLAPCVTHFEAKHLGRSRNHKSSHALTFSVIGGLQHQTKKPRRVTGAEFNIGIVQA